jgi:hypothetical protein
MHIPVLGKLVNMVTFKAVDSATGPVTSLDLTKLLPVPNIFDLIANAGGEAVIVGHREYQRSPLTQVQSGDTAYRGHRTLAEFAYLLRSEAERRSDRKRFIFGYWAGLDILAHSWGPGHPVCALELTLIETILQREVVEPLSRSSGDIAIIVTADHGQASVPETDALALYRVISATGGLRRQQTGERRSVGLEVSSAEQRAAIAAQVGGSGVLIEFDDAVANGLFGPPPLHPELQERLGDVLLLARGTTSYMFRPARDGATPSLGAHGSLTADEMLVPLLVWRVPGT